jgi:hypothetical protein
MLFIHSAGIRKNTKAMCGRERDGNKADEAF